ncbi:MAG: hypothetical protein CMI31_11750 [Opitutae bacterium]|nr:hypothetical protein [Opitutae bacterium]|tara:strand:+ start:1165 stop:1704 length:540 start_codon:yes stop_codon:yes gene_type:complete
MSLFQATLITGIMLIALGLPLLLVNKFTQRLAERFPRSKSVAGVTMIVGTGWFLMRHVLNLSDADFGDYKGLITIISLGILLFSFLYLPDFLAVRGTSILVLLYAREAIDAAFQQEPASRLFMVGAVYVAIALSLYLSAWPYRLRDFIDWLYLKDIRGKVIGATMACYGLFLGSIAYGY